MKEKTKKNQLGRCLSRQRNFDDPEPKTQGNCIVFVEHQSRCSWCFHTTATWRSVVFLNPQRSVEALGRLGTFFLMRMRIGRVIFTDRILRFPEDVSNVLHSFPGLSTLGCILRLHFLFLGSGSGSTQRRFPLFFLFDGFFGGERPCTRRQGDSCRQGRPGQALPTARRARPLGLDRRSFFNLHGTCTRAARSCHSHGHCSRPKQTKTCGATCRIRDVQSAVVRSNTWRTST